MWQFAEAKSRLNEVMTKALMEGPQRIRRRNGTVVILSAKEYGRLTGEPMSFTDFQLAAPDFTCVDLSRVRSPMRDVEL